MKFIYGLGLFLASSLSVDAIFFRDTIADIASENKDLSILVSFLDQAGLVDIFKYPGHYTVFAPVNEAFEALPEDVISKYEDDVWKNHLQSLLLYHVLGTRVFSEDLSVGLETKTLEGNTVEVTSLDPVKINDSEVISADIKASNGVVHVVDTVLLPPSASKTIVGFASENLDSFSTLVDLLDKANLVDTLEGEGPFTVLAPTNKAFEQLPEDTVNFLLDPQNVDVLADVLKYHVISGNAVSHSLTEGQKVDTLEGSTVSVSLTPITINNALVINRDILASNGVIHVIDSVLLPPSIASIADIIKSTGRFSTLEGLVDMAGLISTLDGDGPFTLFAPIDLAFKMLPEAVVEAVTGDAKLLTDVLTYHVIPSEVLSTDLAEGLEVETVFSGNSIKVTSVDPPVINNKAHIVSYDILAKNGVIHAITSVLIPDSVKADNDEECSSSALCKSGCCQYLLFGGQQCRDKEWYSWCV